MNDENNCLIYPSIKCNNNNINYSSHSSKILPNQLSYNNYIQEYNDNLKIDSTNKYLIQLPNRCNIKRNKINQCSNLNNIDDDNIKNIITEESYSLQDYIDDPELLKKFIQNEPNFLKIFLSEFKNLFEALFFLNKKGIAHLKINPKNIIFNQKTKKMKFIHFGEKINKKYLIDYLDKNIKYKYNFNIYYPFICFFVNYSNYNIYKNLTKEQNKDFIHFLKNIFFDENYTETDKSINLYKLKEQFIIIKNDEKFKKYKSYIKSKYRKPEDIINFFKYNDIKNTFRKTFLKYTINAVDIYGLSLSLLNFSEMLKNKYFLDQTIYNILLNSFNDLAINFPSPKISKTCLPEKAFIYFTKKYNSILDYIKKKEKSTNLKKNITTNESQYKLKLSDIIIYNGNSNKNYIDYNGKLMRSFNANNIFTQLNKLSSHNYSMIQQMIDDNISNINRLNILIDKEAYYKIKYNLYCSDNKEVNIYTKRCVTRCPRDYRRVFNDKNFKCTKKNNKNRIIDDKNIKNINDKNKKNIKNIKNKKNIKTKKCPSGYERNPFTKTCTRKCYPGYIRNLKFNCIAEKDVL